MAPAESGLCGIFKRRGVIRVEEWGRTKVEEGGMKIFMSARGVGIVGPVMVEVVEAEEAERGTVVSSASSEGC